MVTQINIVTAQNTRQTATHGSNTVSSRDGIARGSFSGVPSETFRADSLSPSKRRSRSAITRRLNPSATDRTLRVHRRISHTAVIAARGEIAPEPTGHGLPLDKCEAYNRVDDQSCGSS